MLYFLEIVESDVELFVLVREGFQIDVIDGGDSDKGHQRPCPLVLGSGRNLRSYYRLHHLE